MRSIACLPLLAACAVESGGGAEVLLQDQVPVLWDEAYNGAGDGLGALVPVDVMAYDGATGEPLPNVEVQVWTADAAAIPIPPHGVLVLDRDESDVGSVPFVDELTAEIEFWDVLHDRFVAVVPADELALTTDGGGVARLYLFVDAFPVNGGDAFEPIAVIVAAEEDFATLSLVPR